MGLARLGWCGVGAVSLMGLVLTGGAQTPQTQTQTQTQVPDAPVPNAPTPVLPRLNTIVPVAPAIPAQTPVADPNSSAPEAIPGATLPSAPAAALTPEQIAEEAADDAAQGPPPAAHQSDIVVNVNFVEVPFTVKDSKGKQVPGLHARDVRIYENGLRQQMKLFSVDPFPLSVALVIDQSVTFDTMEKVNDSLQALQAAFTPYDEVAVFTYNNGVTKQTDFTASQSPRLGVVLDRSKGAGRDPLMPVGGPLSQNITKNGVNLDPNTGPNHNGQSSSFETVPREFHALNDAILEAAKVAAHAPRGRRRIVYVISDGKEYGSKAKEKDVIRFLQTNSVEVYATLVGDSAVPGMGFLDRIHLPLTMREDVLPRYVLATGGQWDAEFRPRGIEQSFARIAEDARTQYTVGYYSHESLFNEKFRKLEVRVLRPGLTVIAQDGYYPSPQNAHQGVPVASKSAPTPEANPSTTAPAAAAAPQP